MSDDSTEPVSERASVARMLAQAGVTVVLTLVFGWILVIGFVAGSGSVPDAGPAFVGFVALTWIAFIVFALWLVAINLIGRSRSGRFRLLLGIPGAIIAAVIQFVLVLLQVDATAEFSGLVIALSGALVVAFLIGAIIGLLLTHLAVFRRRPAARTTPA